MPTRNRHDGTAHTVVQAHQVGDVHLHAAAAASSATPHQLPPRPRLLVDRAAPLARLEALHAAGAPILLITGAPGVGTSALAAEWAHRAASDYPDGQVFIDLSDQLPAADALGAALRALGQQNLPAAAPERAALWRSLTHDRRLLVLADGASTATQLRPLIPTGAGCLLLAVSPRRLPELALDGARTVVVDPLAAADARTLLERLLDPDDPDPPWAGNRHRLAAAAAGCAGLPVALAVTAGRIRLGATADDLAPTAAVTMQESVMQPIIAAVAALGTPEQALFSALGLHPARAQRIDAAEAAALTGRPAAETARQLHTLAEANLLTPARTGGWHMHLPIAACAHRAALGIAPAEAAAATARLARYLAEEATAADQAANPHRAFRLCWTGPLPPPLEVLSQAEALDWFQVREPVLFGALGAAHDGGLHAETTALAEALRSWMARQRPVRIFQRAVQTGTASAAQLAEPGRRAAMALLANLHHMIHGRFADAEQAAQRALSDAEQAGLALAAGSAWQCRGSALRALGRTREAVQCCRRAVEAAQGHGTPRDEGVQRRFLAETLAADGAREEALAQFGQALQALEGTDPTQAIHVLIALARTYRDQGAHAEAACAAQRALTQAEHLGNSYQIHTARALMADLDAD